MSQTESTTSSKGGALRQIANWFGPSQRDKAIELDGLSDHLLRDIGRARGAGGMDRLHSRRS